MSYVHQLPIPRFLREPQDLLTGYDPAARTLLVESSPGRFKLYPFLLRPGTFEHVAHHNLEAIAEFLYRHRKSAATNARYSAELERFLVFLKLHHHPVITTDALDEYLEQLIQPSEVLRENGLVAFNGVKADTADQYFKVIRSFVAHLHEVGLVPYNLARKVETKGREPEPPNLRRKAFTQSQWAAVLGALEQLPADTDEERNRTERFRFMFLFGYALGLRIHEQRRHTHADIQPEGDHWVLNVVGKGARARALSLTAREGLAWEVLTRYRQHLKLPLEPKGEKIFLLPRIKPVTVRRRGPKPGVFPNPKPLSTSRWEMNFKVFLQENVMQYLYGDDDYKKKAMYAAHWAQLTPHALRHTRITHLVNAGADLMAVQKFAGHQSLNTTSTYFSPEL